VLVGVAVCAAVFAVSGVEHPAIRMDATRRRARPGTKIGDLCIVIIWCWGFLKKTMRKPGWERWGCIDKSTQGNACRNAEQRSAIIAGQVNPSASVHSPDTSRQPERTGHCPFCTIALHFQRREPPAETQGGVVP
jgi:hypothetical protein